MKGGAVIATSSRATAWILVAAAVVVGVLLITGALLSSTPVVIEPPLWTPGGAVVGLLRVGLLAGIGVVVTAAAIWANRRWRH